MEKDTKSGKVQGLTERFKKCTTEMVTLFLLQDQPMYVYELEKEIDRITHDTFHLSTLYPTIYRLLKLGYIKEYSYYVTDSNRLRRYYGITEEGKKRLKHIREEYCQMVQAVSDIMADKK